MTILFWAFALYGSVDSHPWLIVLVIALGLWGLGTIGASLVTIPVDRRLGETVAWVTVALAILAFFAWSYLQVLATPGYGTDEAAFDQYAAQLLVHGVNPYTHSLAQSFSLFHVSPNGFTFGLNGQPITQLSYPALSFLLYAPVVAFGATAQVAIVFNVLAWGIGMALFFAMLPRRIRPMAIVVTSFSVYIGYAVGGVTDALFVPLLIGAVYRWDEFPARHGLAAWRGPVLLGLAMAVKQTPWLVLPFLVAGVALEARRSPETGDRPWSVAARYLADRARCLPRAESVLRFGEPARVVVRDLHPPRQPRGAGRPGLRRTEPLPGHRRRLAPGVLGRAGDHPGLACSSRSCSPTRPSSGWRS